MELDQMNYESLMADLSAARARIAELETAGVLMMEELSALKGCPRSEVNQHFSEAVAAAIAAKDAKP